MTEVADAVETPQQAARRLAAASLAQGFNPEALHTYTSPSGEPLFWRLRLKHPQTGEKRIFPMWRDASGRFVMKEPPAPPSGKPLYRLHELAERPGDAVLICEGEKAADALGKRGCLAATSGSATSAPGADWTPLKGRRVLIWPDNDEPGQRYAADVVQALQGIAAEVRVIDVAALNLPPHGDCVEWLAEHPEATAADVLNLPTLAPQTEPSDAVELVAAADLDPQPVRWLWPGWLAAGKLHILAGAPGTGKTTIALAVAACVSAGLALPDGHIPRRGHAVIWSGEDDATDTLVPRLLAAGADLTRVRFVQGVRIKGERHPFDPATDVPLLAEALRKGPPPSIILIDPIVSAVANDSHKNAEVRRSLAPLVELAAELGASLVGITHYTKGTQGRDPLERVTGSLAFGALARIVWGTVRQQQEGDSERRMTLARAKSNIGPDGGGFAYSFDVVEVTPGLHASRIRWGEALEGTARELLSEPTEASGDELSATEDAVSFLRSLLEDGPMPAKTIRAEAEGAGYAWATIRRAKDRLGVEARKQGGSFGGKGAVWVWLLPQDAQTPEGEHLVEGSHKMLKTPQGANPKVLSALCESEHLVEGATADATGGSDLAKAPPPPPADPGTEVAL
jgi:hypothetical protein